LDTSQVKEMPTENDAMREAGGPGSRAARYVITFENASKDDFAIIGGKCAGLVALIASGAVVPTGFVVTTNAYADSMAAHHLPDAIARLTGGLTVDDIRGQARAAQAIRDLITARPMSERVAEAIHAGYRALCERAGRELPVAVRSSGTAEDLPEASFAGLGDTYLWTVGADAVIERVRDCWASLFTARAIAYRAKNGYGHAVQQMAVVVQQMVNARSAGVAMSLDPSNGDRSKIVIESTWGLGEPLVSGLVTPDYFLIDKVLLEPVKRTIASKLQEMVVDPDARAAVMRSVEKGRQNISSLTEGQLRAVASAVKAVEKALGTPQDIEWAIDAAQQERDSVVLLQSRPETVWSNKKSAPPAKSYATGIEGVLSTLLSPLATRETRPNKNPEGGHYDGAGTLPKSL
jgi:pyruvate, water dikinase